MSDARDINKTAARFDQSASCWRAWGSFRLYGEVILWQAKKPVSEIGPQGWEVEIRSDQDIDWRVVDPQDLDEARDNVRAYLTREDRRGARP
jgi:hypothetical protein